MANEFPGAVWQDRKHGIFGLPWSFTKYVLTEEKLLIIKGAFNRTEDDARKVKELLSDLVEQQRIARGLTIREEMSSGLNDSDHDGVDDRAQRSR